MPFEPTWTDERIELLKRGFAAGLSCREIAADIGVSRNAVIGKLSRLNLNRKGEDAPRVQRKKRDKPRGTRASRLPYEMLAAYYDEPEPAPAEAMVDEGNRCSLLELSESRCRWPISSPGADDFCFCGNATREGVPYCVSHCRLAYRPTARPRLARG